MFALAVLAEKILIDAAAFAHARIDDVLCTDNVRRAMGV